MGRQSPAAALHRNRGIDAWWDAAGDDRRLDESATTEKVESLPGVSASAVEVDQKPSMGRAEALITADPAAAAFFPTWTTRSSKGHLLHFAKGSIAEYFFPTRVIVKALWVQTYFRLVGREKPQDIEAARSATLGFIAGRRVSEVEEVAREIYDESLASRILPGTRRSPSCISMRD